jgi:hypothetical protein
MLSSQEDQHERRETLRNDLKVRREQEESRRTFAPDQSLPKQATTFHQHAIADADTPRGRFSAVSAAYVVGSTAVPAYPAAAAHQFDPCGPEPPLSPDENFAFEPSAVLMTSAEQLGEPNASPLRSGSPISSLPALEVSSFPSPQATDPTSADVPTPLAGQRTDVGSLSSNKPFRRY